MLSQQYQVRVGLAPAAMFAVASYCGATPSHANCMDVMLNQQHQAALLLLLCRLRLGTPQDEELNQYVSTLFVFVVLSKCRSKLNKISVSLLLSGACPGCGGGPWAHHRTASASPCLPPVLSTNCYWAVQEPFLAVVVDPVRTMASGKVEIGAFRTYPEGYKPPDEGPSEYQTIPLSKIEDFGVHAKQVG
jgi:hypothetical protein